MGHSAASGVLPAPWGQQWRATLLSQLTSTVHERNSESLHNIGINIWSQTTPTLVRYTTPTWSESHTNTDIRYFCLRHEIQGGICPPSTMLRFFADIEISSSYLPMSVDWLYLMQCSKSAVPDTIFFSDEANRWPSCNIYGDEVG